MLSAIVLAAGVGLRLKARLPKPLVRISGLPAIIYSLRTFNYHPEINEIIVVCSASYRKLIVETVRKYPLKKIKSFVLGGSRRQDSVACGLKEINPDSDLVLIHDSARPFITGKLITQVIAQAKKNGAAVLAVRPKATIKFSKNNNFVEQTLERNNLWEIQTPQVFKKELILKAYQKYCRQPVTDDSALVEKLGKKVKIVPGSYENIKITTNEDLLFAELISQRFKNAI